MIEGRNLVVNSFHSISIIALQNVFLPNFELMFRFIFFVKMVGTGNLPNNHYVVTFIHMYDISYIKISLDFNVKISSFPQSSPLFTIMSTLLFLKSVVDTFRNLIYNTLFQLSRFL